MRILNQFFSLSIIPLVLSCPHKDIPFSVELAQTPQERAKGLMFRESLEENTGMLFLYNGRDVSMWMKNTLIPLDMIFGDGQGHILAIYENTTPYSLSKIGPVSRTASVLEIAGGTVAKQGISQQCQIYLPKALAP